MAKRIRFMSGDLALTGLLDLRTGDRGAVITHPHPLYGGDMENPVVEAIYRAYARRGYSTLRFNFRGVGSSAGAYDNGIGERRDLDAAISFLMDRGLVEVDRAGYSFGTWVSTFAEGPDLASGKVLMVSPPVAFMDFSAAEEMPQLLGVASGELDDIAPAEGVRQLIDRLNPSAAFHLVPGADHFYGGCFDRLAAALDEIIRL